MTPTINQIADALSYINHEFDISNGRVDSEQWAEGFAFAREGLAQSFGGDRWAYDSAHEMIGQFNATQWAHVMARADRMRACGGFAGFDRPKPAKKTLRERMTERDAEMRELAGW